MVSAATSDDFGPAHRFNGARTHPTLRQLAGLVVCRTVFFVRSIAVAETNDREPDTVITLLSFAAFVVWWNGIAAGGVSILRWIVCGLLLAALAMAKGPQPAGFFALGTAAYLMVERRWRDLPGWLLCMIVPLAAAIAWGVAVYQTGVEATWLSYAASTTSAIGEPLFDVVGAVGTTAPTTTGTTQTVRQTNTTATGLDHVVIGSSTAPGAGATSITMSWTIPSADWAQVVVPIKASTALTAVAVSNLTATLEASDVLVQWNDGYEPSSLGFYVYRSDGTGGRVQLNGAVISGGALGAGASSFSWKDASGGWDGAVSYWVEDVGLDGSATWYGPVTPRPAGATGATGGAPATSSGGTPGGNWPGTGGQAPAESPAAGGCTVAARDPRSTVLQLVLALGLVAGVRRRKGLAALVVLYALAVAVSGLLAPRSAAGAGGVAIDTSATGTGASGLTFSHTMGAGSNGLLVVGVVVPIICDDINTDAGHCGVCDTPCAPGRRSFTQHGSARPVATSTKGAGTTSADSSGNGNTATLFNSPSWATGYSGDAVEGNGTTSYLQANIGTWFGGNNTLSVSAWTYVNANSNGPVVGIAGGGGWNMPFLSVRGSTVYGWLWGVPGTDQTTSPLAATVGLDAWHFLAITYDPNGGGPASARRSSTSTASPRGRPPEPTSRPERPTSSPRRSPAPSRTAAP